MPISSGAGGRRARVVPPASKRATSSSSASNTKRRQPTANLKHSPNWSDELTRSSPALATSGANQANQDARYALQSTSVKTLRRSHSQQQQTYGDSRLGEQLNEQVAINQAAKASTNRLRQLMNSLGGQRVLTGSNLESRTASAEPKTMNGAGLSKKQGSLFTAFMVGGQGGQGTAAVDTRPAGGDAQPTTTNHLATSDYKKPRMLGGKTYMISANGAAMTGAAYHQHSSGAAPQQSTPSLTSASKSSLQNSQASLLNPSMSLLSDAAAAARNQTHSGATVAAASASNSLANLHNLHNHHLNQKHNHKQQQQHQLSASATQLPTTGQQRARLNISKRVNLKYVKSLIVLLMSLDLLITIFVHHFASNDQLTIALTSHKLRFSLLNLVLSAIWFVVLAGAIIFDIYAILLIGCLVDFASFILLLVCSVIHFTHRIDYNTVNLTSLLLLLFSIIVLHVYLLVIATLTTYLMLAVKRRQKIQS